MEKGVSIRVLLLYWSVLSPVSQQRLHETQQKTVTRTLDHLVPVIPVFFMDLQRMVLSYLFVLPQELHVGK
jgi:hypothetical protein